ncbi:hypothetical protein M9H77_21021 [Catharanthus roseus]|uniref:Uncharacterized protein n=1 Tax=Catharanthus roseus TaxID=4058 RepID=A0ACC0AP28_CATRO|nr:hypothetical protein M9H77_21021 [Catharanthus roseus]
MQRNMQCYNRAQRTRFGSQNEVIGNKSGISYYRFLGHLLGLPWDQPRCRVPPDSSLSGRTPPKSMMRCPRRPIGRHPPRSMPLLKWIHSPEFKSSTPSEEAIIRGTSHVQCNLLTLPNTST